MNEVRLVEVTPAEAQQRLDNYLMRLLKGVPKSCIYRIIRAGEVRVNRKRAKPLTKLQAGDCVRIPPVRMSPAQGAKPVVGEGLARHLDDAIIHEDSHLIVLNKPAGLAVHGGSGLSFGVIEALRAMRADSDYLELVHRLDRETSGCLLIAKRRSALRALQASLAAREVQKTYLALLNGRWSGNPTRTVNVALEKNTRCQGERHVSVSENGKPSRTVFRLLENFADACLVEASPLTGRTHQIRVHAAHIGHPLVGDMRYGDPEAFPLYGEVCTRLCLHASAIRFTLSEKTLRFEAELDKHFHALLEKLRKRSEARHG